MGHVAQSLALVVEFFHEALAFNEGLSTATQTALRRLYRLFAYYYLELDGNDCKLTRME
jgi:hypothetical protein